jgi:formate-dependent phosphoribosylglycinamide formyltransferase (GAR transformylase)
MKTANHNMRRQVELKTPRRLMILCSTTGYQTRAFADAAREMVLQVTFGSDRCHVLDDPWRDGALPLRFEDAEGATRQIIDYAQKNPVDGIVALGDQSPPVAARACRLLDLPYHSPQAADFCRDKYLSRSQLQAAGLNVPRFTRFHVDSDPRQLLNGTGGGIDFPCVLKPLALSASRGVIRADDRDQFVKSFERIRNLLRSPEVKVMREESSDYIQAEEYIEGTEIAVEGIVVYGAMRILAIFDKPDPLGGPFFEETIYVTPTRLPAEVKAEVRKTLTRALAALQLFHGPFHAEMRINREGVWPLEVAARPIGGLCSRALRFHSQGGGKTLSLERLLISLALGEAVNGVEREECASGVMMIPVIQEGIYEAVEGIEEALAVPGVEDVVITAKHAQRLIAWPEGCSYPGFIFARGPSPQFVEDAIRRAHCKLKFKISPSLPVVDAVPAGHASE